MKTYLKQGFVVIVAIAGIAYGLHLSKKETVQAPVIQQAEILPAPTENVPVNFEFTTPMKVEAVSKSTATKVSAPATSTAPAKIDLKIAPAKSQKTSQVQTCVWPHVCSNNA